MGRLLSSSASVQSMQKWGIPQQEEDGSASASPEIALLERLVWVRYQGHWWPALLYHSYSELQQHLYEKLDTVLKAQFAMAIMKQVQQKRKVKVARLLGRTALEVMEIVDSNGYCEFYWKLPNILPLACRKSSYRGNMELFFDFHRALDQIEQLIREISMENFELMPDSGKQSWLDRARTAARNNDDESTIFSSGGEDNGRGRRRRSQEKKNKRSFMATGPESVPSSPRHDLGKNGSQEGLFVTAPSSASSRISHGGAAAPARSIKTKDSQAATEVVDNRKSSSHQRVQPSHPYYHHPPSSSVSTKMTTPPPILVEEEIECREPDSSYDCRHSEEESRNRHYQQEESSFADDNPNYNIHAFRLHTQEAHDVASFSLPSVPDNTTEEQEVMEVVIPRKQMEPPSDDVPESYTDDSEQNAESEPSRTNTASITGDPRNSNCNVPGLGLSNSIGDTISTGRTTMGSYSISSTSKDNKILVIPTVQNSEMLRHSPEDPSEHRSHYADRRPHTSRRMHHPEEPASFWERMACFLSSPTTATQSHVAF